MLANRDTQRLAWQLTRERWAEIQKKTGEFVGNTVIVGALAAFCDAATAAEIKALLQHAQGAGRRAHAAAVARADRDLRGVGGGAGAEAGGVAQGARAR